MASGVHFDPNMHAPEVGEVIGGYRFERMLAVGSVGRVYVGVHTKLRREAAIKVVELDRAEDPRIVERLVTEARVVNEIRHPAIVDIRDIVECSAPRRIALVMELISGPSLKALIELGARPSFVQSMGIMYQLAEALDAAHARGVVHRDIKPANLLLTTALPRDPLRVPALKIVDFGIAKLAGSPATDVYAYASVFCELLTGRRLPEMLLPAVPGAVMLIDAIKRALSLNPAARPTLAELRAVILEICPEARPRKSWPRRPSPPARSVRTDRPATEEELLEVTVHEATITVALADILASEALK